MTLGFSVRSYMRLGIFPGVYYRLGSRHGQNLDWQAESAAFHHTHLITVYVRGKYLAFLLGVDSRTLPNWYLGRTRCLHIQYPDVDYNGYHSRKPGLLFATILDLS